MPAKCNLTIDDVSPYFCFPIEEAAQKLGVCVTVLKKVCRGQGTHLGEDGAGQNPPGPRWVVRVGWCGPLTRRVRGFGCGVDTGISRWPLQRLRYVDQRIAQYAALTGWTFEIQQEMKKLLMQRNEALNGLKLGTSARCLLPRARLRGRHSSALMMPCRVARRAGLITKEFSAEEVDELWNLANLPTPPASVDFFRRVVVRYV